MAVPPCKSRGAISLSVDKKPKVHARFLPMKLFPPLALVVALGCLPFITGCTSNKSMAIPGTSLAPTNPDSIQVLNATPDRNFRVVGTVEIQRGIGNLDSQKTLVRKYQVEAAKLGAQAVIIDTMPQATITGMNKIKGTARAIVWDNSKPRD